MFLYLNVSTIPVFKSEFFKWHFIIKVKLLKYYIVVLSVAIVVSVMTSVTLAYRYFIKFQVKRLAVILNLHCTRCSLTTSFVLRGLRFLKLQDDFEYIQISYTTDV